MYNNVYSWTCNQMILVKSNGGSGYFMDSSFTNFIGHSNAYSLDINAFWTDLVLQDGNGVLYQNLTFDNFIGTAANGTQRAPIQVLCPDDTPCTDITISNFDMWTDEGESINYVCENAWGTGGCLSTGTADMSYAVTTSAITATP
jgi:rhamnogalacturonan hydrolase